MEELLICYLLVMFAHYLGDFPLQGEFLGVMKGKYDYLLFVHCVIWTGCVCVALSYLGLFAWWKLGFLLSGHWFVDRWKARHPYKELRGLTHLLWIDQFIHAVQCAVVVGW